MQPTVLVASSSDYRRWWYRHHLTHGYCVCVVEAAAACLTQLRQGMPRLLILETPLLWGGAEGVLEILDRELNPAQTRILLVKVTHDAGEMYRVSRYVVDDVLSRSELESCLVDHVHRLLL